jgi:hypothetical protein
MFKRLFSGSRMTRECHVRFCEGFSGKFRRSTHQKKCIALLLFYSSLTAACPTCIGRVKSESIPFFHKDFYQPPSKPINKELYAQEQFQRLLQQTKGK